MYPAGVSPGDRDGLVGDRSVRMESRSDCVDHTLGGTFLVGCLGSGNLKGGWQWPLTGEARSHALRDDFG
jgi:hypothetical protein